MYRWQTGRRIDEKMETTATPVNSLINVRKRKVKQRKNLRSMKNQDLRVSALKVMTSRGGKINNALARTYSATKLLILYKTFLITQFKVNKCVFMLPQLYL